ncbi:hypothetical protein FRC17_010105 [Serendipita sp. 399]|nr:hypothetical protein FRC17_010105 [Serendipita sp. 399]
MALPQVQAALRIHAEGLGHLQKFQAGVKQTEQIKRLQMKEEKETSQLYEKFDSILSEYTSQSMGVVEGQVQLVHAEIRRLQDLHQNMERELRDWMSLQDKVVSTLTYLNPTKDRLEEDIQSTKAITHPIRRIPIDVWVDMFKILAEDEYFAYLRHNTNHPLRPAAHILSHVCRLWRQILADSSDLWRTLFTYPGNTWPKLCTAYAPMPHTELRFSPAGEIWNERPVSLPSANFSSTHPRLCILELLIDKFPESFQLDGYLPQTLKHLYIRDIDGTSLPSLTTNLQLPSLQRLGINYPAHGVIERLEMKALKCLILYPYNFPGATPATGPQALATYLQLSAIRFEEWSKPNNIEGDPYYGAVGTLSRLVQYTPALHSLAFYRCYVDGGAFIELIKSSKEKDASKSLPMLEQIVLSHTEGITRDHCDELKQMVTKIKVFR